MTRSATARQNGISNKPSLKEITALQTLWRETMIPICEMFGKRVKVNSGYRCKALNDAVGSSDKSFHLYGMACDFEIEGVSNREIYEAIIANTDIPFTEMALENHKTGEHGSGWVHIALDPDRKGKRRAIEIRTRG